jgi:hypothetical protein
MKNALIPRKNLFLGNLYHLDSDSEGKFNTDPKRSGHLAYQYIGIISGEPVEADNPGHGGHLVVVGVALHLPSVDQQDLQACQVEVLHCHVQVDARQPAPKCVIRIGPFHVLPGIISRFSKKRTAPILRGGKRRSEAFCSYVNLTFLL